MINSSPYFPSQMNGVIISSYAKATEDELKKTNQLTDYLYELKIQIAQVKELELIGCLLGYPRPLIPEGFNTENLLLLGRLPLESDSTIGLSTIVSDVGGVLSTITPSNDNFMDINLYRKILPKVALLKRYGVTIRGVDLICSTIGMRYQMSFNGNMDIEIRFDSDIGYKNVWILTQLFYKFATQPQVIFFSGGT